MCPTCRVRLVPEEGLGLMGEGKTLNVRVSPILRDALACARPGEDFDEALLRALKARHPEDATSLLSAVARMVEAESKRASEDRQQTVRRLAEADPGPEIVLRTSMGEPTTITAESRVIRIGDKEYHSLEEVPPHLRGMIERAMSGRRPTARAGCVSAIVTGWLLSLMRAAGK